MTPGSRPRRFATRTAGAAVAALLLSLGGGCHAVPIGRIAAAPNRPKSTLGAVARDALLPATVALDIPAETAAIDPNNSARGKVTPASVIGASPKVDLISTESPADRPEADAEVGRPTPLLDEALVRARRHVEVPDPVAPASPPHLLPPSPPPAAEASVAAATVVPIVEPPAPEARPLAEVQPAPAPEPAPAAPEDLWRDGVRKLVGLARARQEQGAGGAEPWGLRAGILSWLAEPDIDPDLGHREADAVRAVLRTLQAATGPNDVAPRADDVKAAVAVLEARAPLELVALQLCSQVDGFGDCVPFDPPSRRAGDLVILYCEVDGVHHEPAAGGLLTKVAGQLEIIPEGGGAAVIHPLGTAEEVFPRRRRDYYINFKKRIPRDLPPGPYTVRVTVRDVATERASSRSTPLTILPAAPVEPVPTP